MSSAETPGTIPRRVPDPHRAGVRSPRRPRTGFLAGIVAALLVLVGSVTMSTASAATNPYERGPAPTGTSVAADRGPFATAQLTVAKGNGFGGGVVYYPTDTSQGTFGAIAIAPGYGTEWRWYAWLGPRLASFGFVVLGIETNSLDDYADARGAQLLSALDWLVDSSPVRDRVDRTRLAVGGHSMGGGGALTAAIQRPSLMTAIGMAPYVPDGILRTIKIPTVLFGGQTDTTVTPSYLASAYATIPATVQRAYPEIANEGHGFAAGGGGGNSGAFARTMMIWMKVFIDKDTRYTGFLCPTLSNMSGISKYQASCPLGPTSGPSQSPSSSPSSTPSSSPSSTPSVSPSSTPSASPPGGPCRATYRTVNSWSGGYQGEVTVTAGGSAVNGWTVKWALSGGQSVTQVWNGTLSASGSNVSVSNASYNGSLGAGASTTFGFLANGTPSTPSPTCTSP
ncbi:cellulose-binding domain-containing protein [Microbispora sp. RL4-1S]|uniref:Poly(ethylene terephthalate) hydrolase n=1 Tax=Microbispora oryzae TaxID=2806554 RepID=A0A941ALA2_9ACTN|nr:cellulose-binding domain-containing protein [Microbispora oryzae]MBP2706078.1 cellulose-binding domain-containing protein [Microbispora oryzae]